MNIQITTRSLDLTPDQRAYIEDKLNNIVHLGKELEDPANLARVEVDYREVENAEKRVTIEVTLNVPHSIIRVTQDSSTVEEGMDLAAEKMRRQIERYRGKLHQRNKEENTAPIPNNELEGMTQQEAENIPKITKRKRFTLYRQMHEDEAIEQMKLIDHDFYLFWNQDTNRFSVVYKRKDGSYGIIEPKIETNNPEGNI